MNWNHNIAPLLEKGSLTREEARKLLACAEEKEAVKKVTEEAVRIRNVAPAFSNALWM